MGPASSIRDTDGSGKTLHQLGGQLGETGGQLGDLGLLGGQLGPLCVLRTS